MEELLGTAPLKTGEQLRVLCITGPDSAWKDRVAPFLGHKGGNWQWHIENALNRALDGLETRFYLGELNGEIVANICTFEASPVGILGHVYTRPDQRRKGICEAVMTLQTADFRRRGGRFMTLGTGFDSAPYHIYERFGFRGIAPGSGMMRLDADPGYLAEAAEHSDTIARPLRWDDWPRLNVTSLISERPVLRGIRYQLIGQCNLESAGISIIRSREQDSHQGAWVLESRRGSIVGLATVAADPLWRGVWILDLWVLPSFAGDSKKLVSAAALPEGKVLCYLEPGQPEVAGALVNAGFEKEGTLRHQPGPGNVDVWGRLVKSAAH